ncbi:MAG: phosphate ABC transporter, permease protein PstA [Pyrobaculum sp.]
MKRRLVSKLGMAAFAALGFLAVAPLFFIIGDIYLRGIPAIAQLGGLGFFWSLPPAPTDERGGIGPQIVGTLYMVFIGATLGFLIGFPIGVYVGEFKKDLLAQAARAGVNILVEFPTVTIGIFVYSVFSFMLGGRLNEVLQGVSDVLSKHLGGWVLQFVGPLSQFNAYAGATALAIVMIPYVALFTASAYASIEQPIREAAYAVSGREYKAVFVVMRKAVSRAVVVAALLGTAKIAGETAPLLFTAFGNLYYAPFTQPTAAVPLWIYYAAESPYEVLISSAYAAAAVLLTIVLALFLLARARG